MIPSLPRSQVLTWFENGIGAKTSLRRRALVGSQWLVAKSIVQAGLEVVKVAVFARLLSPEDYGLMALAVLPIGLLDSFSATGMELMVQREGDDCEKRLADYWTLRLFRGLMLFLLAWFAALPLAAYYQQPELIPLVRFLGLAFVFDGAAAFGREIRQRRLQFAHVMLADTLIAVVLLAAGLIVLFFERNAWALAFYQVASSFLGLIASFAMFPWRPRLSLNPSTCKSVAGFAGSLITVNVLNYLFSNLDKSIVGKTLGLEQLGLYTRGYFLALIPAIYCFNAVAPVMLNTFRTLLGEPERMAKAFRKTAVVFLLIGSAMAGVLFAGARELIVVLYGEKWLPLQPVFQVLTIFTLSKCVVSVCSPVFILREKQWMISLSTAVMVALFLILCYPLTAAFGTVGTAWAVVVSSVVSHLLSFCLVFRLLPAGAGALRVGE